MAEECETCEENESEAELTEAELAEFVARMVARAKESADGSDDEEHPLATKLRACFERGDVAHGRVRPDVTVDQLTVAFGETLERASWPAGPLFATCLDAFLNLRERLQSMPYPFTGSLDDTHAVLHHLLTSKQADAEVLRPRIARIVHALRALVEVDSIWLRSDLGAAEIATQIVAQDALRTSIDVEDLLYITRLAPAHARNDALAEFAQDEANALALLSRPSHVAAVKRAIRTSLGHYQQIIDASHCWGPQFVTWRLAEPLVRQYERAPASRAAFAAVLNECFVTVVQNMRFMMHSTRYWQHQARYAQLLELCLCSAHGPSLARDLREGERGEYVLRHVAVMLDPQVSRWDAPCNHANVDVRCALLSVLEAWVREAPNNACVPGVLRVTVAHVARTDLVRSVPDDDVRCPADRRRVSVGLALLIEALRRDSTLAARLVEPGVLDALASRFEQARHEPAAVEDPAVLDAVRASVLDVERDIVDAAERARAEGDPNDVAERVLTRAARRWRARPGPETARALAALLVSADSSWARARRRRAAAAL